MESVIFGISSSEPPESLLLKVDEVAALLKMGRSKIYEMTNSGELPSIRIGTCVRVSRSALQRWIAGLVEKQSID